jgi:hypothetical protein
MAVVGLGTAGAGTGAGSSTNKGCCGAAPAIPLPNPIAPIAASANAIPTVARVSGPRPFEIANMFRNKGTPQIPLEHQDVKSLRQQCSPIVTMETRHDHSSNSTDLLINLGICLLWGSSTRLQLSMCAACGSDNHGIIGPWFAQWGLASVGRSCRIGPNGQLGDEQTGMPSRLCLRPVVGFGCSR